MQLSVSFVIVFHIIDVQHHQVPDALYIDASEGKGTNYVRMTIGDILPEYGRTREVKILVSKLKYVKRITRQQAHVVARKEKERRKNIN